MSFLWCTPLSKKNPPRRGIEPRSPAWQAGILTTILPRTRLRGRTHESDFSKSRRTAKCITLHQKEKRDWERKGNDKNVASRNDKKEDVTMISIDAFPFPSQHCIRSFWHGRSLSFNGVRDMVLSKQQRGWHGEQKHRWSSGRILACHAGDPGSIPGRCKCFGTGIIIEGCKLVAAMWLLGWALKLDYSTVSETAIL